MTLSIDEIDKAVQEIMEINGQDGSVNVITDTTTGERIALYYASPPGESIEYTEAQMAELLEARGNAS
jgi:hypothetical protein